MGHMGTLRLISVPHTALRCLFALQVWMWLRPKGKGLSARPDVKRIPLSSEAACLSLGHFLQVCDASLSYLAYKGGG